MRRGIKFEFETSNISDAIEKAEKQLPNSTEKVLKKVASNIAKDLGNRVDAEAEGHNYYPDGIRLAKSFRRGKIIKSGTKWTCAVTSTAPHYRMYEDGHELFSHKPKKRKNGTRHAGSYRHLGRVEGRKTVARYMGQRAQYSELIAEEILNEILKEAGLS